MLNEDQYMDRTPDLIAKVRQMREAAEKEIDRFTRVANYDVRRVVGLGPKPVPVSEGTVASSPANEWPKRSTAKIAATQTSIDFAPAPVESVDPGESA